MRTRIYLSQRNFKGSHYDYQPVITSTPLSEIRSISPNSFEWEEFLHTAFGTSTSTTRMTDDQPNLSCPVSSLTRTPPPSINTWPQPYGYAHCIVGTPKQFVNSHINFQERLLASVAVDPSSINRGNARFEKEQVQRRNFFSH